MLRQAASHPLQWLWLEHAFQHAGMTPASCGKSSFPRRNVCMRRNLPLAEGDAKPGHAPRSSIATGAVGGGHAVSEGVFRYDAEQDSYTAIFPDCHMTATEVDYDERHHFVGYVRATLADETLLNHKRLRLLDGWACEKFAEECDGRPEGQRKARQYLTQFADWIQRQHGELAARKQWTQVERDRHEDHASPGAAHASLTTGCPTPSRTGRGRSAMARSLL